MSGPVRVLWQGVVVLALLTVACGGDPGGRAGSSLPSLGTIAYVDAGGCIARVEVPSGGSTSGAFCPGGLGAVSAVTWLDAERVAYATPETEHVGWRVYDFATGSDGPLPQGEGPPFVHVGPSQPYSISGDLLRVDAEGAAWVEHGTLSRKVFAREADPGDRFLPELLTWSPDGEWALLSYSQSQALVVVDRAGSQVVDVAASSRALASWYMPEAGATPHMDLTCGLPTVSTLACVPLLREVDASREDASGMLLTWQACLGATGYQVQALGADSDAPLVDAVTAGASFRLSRNDVVSAGGSVRWRVRVLVGRQAGSWSEYGALPGFP